MSLLRPRVLALSALLFALPAIGSAAENKAAPETSLHRIQRAVAMIDAEAATPGGETRVISRLSQQLRVSPDTLQFQHDAWALSYGEIAMAYGFSRASRTGKRPADVVDMRRSGMDWFAIAKELGVRVDAVATKMKRHVGPKTR